MKTLFSIDLYFQDSSINSDKEYHLQLVNNGGTYTVDFQYGRRGSTLNTGTKISTDVLAIALKSFHKVKDEKMAKGYQEEKSGDKKQYVSVAIPVVKAPEPKKEDKTIGVGRKVLWEPPTTTPEVIIPQLLNSIEEDEVEKYLNDDAFGAQEKKDGKHQTIRVTDGVMTVYNKKGKEIGYPSAWTACVVVKDIVLDGEAIGEQFHAFDLLEAEGEDLRPATYATRYERLTKLFKKNVLRDSIKLVPLACTSKKALYEQLKKDKKEGVVFKRLSSVYKPGKGHSDLFKFKFYAELSAKVTKGRDNKNSIGLELLDEKGMWNFMGYCTVAPSKMPVPMGSVVEIRYLNCMKGGHLYQPSYKEPRDDIDLSECTMSQIKYKSEED